MRLPAVEKFAPLNGMIACFWITVANRASHYLSRSEIDGAKRISQHPFGRAAGLMRKNLFSDYRELHVLDVRLLYSPLTGYGEITSR